MVLNFFWKFIHNINRDYFKVHVLLLKLLKIRLVQVVLVLVVVIFTLPFFVFYLYRPVVNPNMKYGVTFSNKYAETIGLDWRLAYQVILDDLNVKYLRLPVYWEDVEKNKGEFDFSEIKWQLEEAQKRDVNVILAIGRKVPRWPECFEPEWWNEIPEEEVRDYHLLRYIENTVKELKKYENIEMWQVENEPFFFFGDCKFPLEHKTVEKEVQVARSIDSRPIVIQDSGEGGFWFPSYRKGDYLAISMYRKVWIDFWKPIITRYFYFQYPLPSWSYRIKALITFVPADKIIITEAQAEPWGPGYNHELSREEKNKTMSRADFLSVITYTQRSGFERVYYWGVEWWLFEKDKLDEPFYWDTAKALMN